jgi:hypothetical protein
VAQVCSHRLPTAAARVRDRGKSSVRSVVDRAALGQMFSQHFGFPCRAFIPLTSPQLSPYTIQGWYSRPINSAVRVGLVPKRRAIHGACAKASRRRGTPTVFPLPEPHTVNRRRSSGRLADGNRHMLSCHLLRVAPNLALALDRSSGADYSSA